ncbi:MAG: recombinase family protein [Alistipes sp.]|nr:recombinase family protein [Alistipes sp.]
MEERTKVVIYARVSTSTQDYTRQITELRNYAWKQNYQIVKEFSEKISGGKKIEERAAIKELLDFVKSNKVEKVLVYECSRLSRRQLDFLSIIEQLTEARVSLYILQNGLETLLPDGRPNPIANLCFGIIAEFNNLEKILIRARMASGYEHHRALGGRVGRKEGYRKSEEDYRTHYDREITLLQKGNTLADVRAITGTSINTLRKLKEKYCLVC